MSGALLAFGMAMSALCTPVAASPSSLSLALSNADKPDADASSPVYESRKMDLYARRDKAAPEVLQAIKDVADENGADLEFMLDKAARESSFRPDVGAPTSSAVGIYQFVEQTWFSMIRDYGAQYGLAAEAAQIEQNPRDGKLYVRDPTLSRAILNLRHDPHLAAEMSYHLDQDNAVQLQAAFGRPASRADLYLAHFLGAKGAIVFLSQMQNNPGRIAASVVPAAAAANYKAFHLSSGRAMTLQEMYRQIAQEFEDGSNTPRFVEVAYLKTPHFPSTHRTGYAEEHEAPLRQKWHDLIDRMHKGIDKALPQIVPAVYTVPADQARPAQPVPVALKRLLNQNGDQAQPAAAQTPPVVAEASPAVDVPPPAAKIIHIPDDQIHPVAKPILPTPPVASRDTGHKVPWAPGGLALLGAGGLGYFLRRRWGKRKTLPAIQPSWAAAAAPVTSRPNGWGQKYDRVPANDRAGFVHGLSAREAQAFGKHFGQFGPQAVAGGAKWRADCKPDAAVTYGRNRLAAEGQGLLGEEGDDEIRRTILAATDAWSDRRISMLSCNSESLRQGYKRVAQQLVDGGILQSGFVIEGVGVFDRQADLSPEAADMPVPRRPAAMTLGTPGAPWPGLGQRRAA